MLIECIRKQQSYVTKQRISIIGIDQKKWMRLSNIQDDKKWKLQIN